MSLPEEQKLIKTSTRSSTQATAHIIGSRQIKEVTSNIRTAKSESKEMIGGTTAIKGGGTNVHNLRGDQDGETQDLHNVTTEYRFIHQNMIRQFGLERILLPFMLFLFELMFIILFAIFATYKNDATLSNQVNEAPTYTMFQDVHIIAVLGFGLIMAFLKRYGYGSIGFNLLLVAFVLQWSLLVRGWIQWNTGGGRFTIGLAELVHADFTTISILIAYGVLIGKTTALQLATMAFAGVLVQVANDHLNNQVYHAHDVGKAIFVHLFGCIYGLAVSKALHTDGIVNSRQSSVYHSDLFAFIGTLFFWVFYPSLNAILAHDEGVSKAIINTYLSIAASTVISIGLSSLVGKGRLSAVHVQHATFAGGIAIGSIADCNLQGYIALIIGSIAGLLSTLGYQYVTPKWFSALRIHDSCGNFNLHGIPAIVSGLFSVIFAMSNILEMAKQKVVEKVSDFVHVDLNETLHTDAVNLTLPVDMPTVLHRLPITQCYYQLAALGTTIGIALVAGTLVGFILRLPIFDQLNEDVEMYDDEAHWITPEDYALKLTHARDRDDDADQTIPLQYMSHKGHPILNEP